MERYLETWINILQAINVLGHRVGGPWDNTRNCQENCKLQKGMLKLQLFSLPFGINCLILCCNADLTQEKYKLFSRLLYAEYISLLAVFLHWYITILELYVHSGEYTHTDPHIHTYTHAPIHTLTKHTCRQTHTHIACACGATWATYRRV